jgi:hypothetical protein
MIPRPSLRSYSPKRLEDGAFEAVGFLRWIHPGFIVGA